MYPEREPMEPRKAEGDEAVEAIMGILRRGGKPVTTREVGVEMQKLQLRCPDTTIVFLNKLRRNGVIHGERSKELRGWIWWVD
jgi:hypothetical protein